MPIEETRRLSPSFSSPDWQSSPVLRCPSQIRSQRLTRSSSFLPLQPSFRTGRWSHPTPVVFRGYPHVWKRNADAEVKPVELNNKLIESLFDVLKSGEILELEPSPTSTSMVESEEDEPIGTD